MNLLTKSEHNLLGKILFLRMHDLSNRVYTSQGFALALFGQEIAATDALFEKLFGSEKAESCRIEWTKIIEIGAEAYSADLADRGLC